MFSSDRVSTTCSRRPAAPSGPSSSGSRHFRSVVDHGIPPVCLVDPGYDVTVTIASDIATWHAVWLGRMPLAAALRIGPVTLGGPTVVTRRVAQVLRLSPVAPFVDGRYRREVPMAT